MKVALISNYLPDGQESMLRFADMLATGLKEQGHEVILWHPPVILGRLGGPSALKKWLAYLDKYPLAWRSLRQAVKDADVVHILDHSNAMYGPWLGRANWWVTCHDLLAVRSAQGEFEHQKTGLTGRQLQRWILTSMKRSPRIIAVSKTTENDLHRLAPETSGRTQVIWNGLNAPFQRQEKAQIRSGLDEMFHNRGLSRPERYLFHIGGNQWYKNRDGVIAIFAQLTQQKLLPGLQLVMAGKPPAPQHLQEIERLNLQENIQWLGEVSGGELETLYNGAEALLFPSLAEGFGWPIVEALACGCPVITSNRPPMTEISGADSLFIEPEKADEAGRLIAAWLSVPGRRSEASVQSRWQHSQIFSVQAMMASYLKAYQTAR